MLIELQLMLMQWKTGLVWEEKDKQKGKGKLAAFEIFIEHAALDDILEDFRQIIE